MPINDDKSKREQEQREKELEELIGGDPAEPPHSPGQFIIDRMRELGPPPKPPRRPRKPPQD